MTSPNGNGIGPLIVRKTASKKYGVSPQVIEYSIIEGTIRTSPKSESDVRANEDLLVEEDVFQLARERTLMRIKNSGRRVRSAQARKEKWEARLSELEAAWESSNAQDD